MRKVTAFFFLAAVFLTLSCSQNPAKENFQNRKPNMIQGHEGFFTPEELHAPASEIGFSENILLPSVYSVGLSFIEQTYAVDVKKQTQLQAAYCATSRSEVFFSSFCKKLAAEECKKSCSFQDSALQGSGVRMGDLYLTARHIGENLLAAKHASVRFQNKDGQVREFALKATKFSTHSLPYDFSVFQIVDWDQKFDSHVVLIRKEEPVFLEPVYGIGFPVMTGRKTELKSYSLKSQGLRFTVARVVDGNLLADSFCKYTNSGKAPEIELWQLQKDCSQADLSGLPYKPRQEKDPILVDSDFVFAMDGSPLFDAKGSLIGIASTVLSKTPAIYDSEKSAVYVKAANLLDPLKELQKTSAGVK